MSDGLLNASSKTRARRTQAAGVQACRRRAQTFELQHPPPRVLARRKSSYAGVRRLVRFFAQAQLAQQRPRRYVQWLSAPACGILRIAGGVSAAAKRAAWREAHARRVQSLCIARGEDAAPVPDAMGTARRPRGSCGGGLCRAPSVVRRRCTSSCCTRWFEGGDARNRHMARWPALGDRVTSEARRPSAWQPQARQSKRIK